MFNPDAGVWPSPKQELILRASLLHGSECFNAWNILKSNIDVDNLDYQSQLLLPLLYRNLSSQKVEDPLLKKFKGIYRLTWTKNSLLFKKAENTLKSLWDSNIRIILLKSVPLISLYYKDKGLWPMGDIDILVKSNQVWKAVDYFEKSGWVPTTKYPDLRKEAYFIYHHSVGFTNQQDQNVDLHRSLLFPSPIEDFDTDFWDGAVQSEINGLPVLILNPTDMLIHICIHGLREHNAEIFRWIADAMTILKHKSPEIDWGRLLDQARKRRLVLDLSNGLGYLADLLDAPIPLQVLETLNNEKVSAFERWEFKYGVSNKRPLGRIPGFWFYYVRCLVPEFYTPIKFKFSGFLSFLRLNWGANNMWEFGSMMLSKGIKRIQRLFESGQPALGSENSDVKEPIQ